MIIFSFKCNMKTIVLTGSSPFLHQNPRLTSLYMVAIIRRQRFFIIIVISFLILLIFSWNFHRKGKINFNVKQNDKILNDEVRTFQHNKQYFYDITRRPDNIGEDQRDFKGAKKILEEEGISPFLKKTDKHFTENLVEDLEYFIPEKELTTRDNWQTDQETIITDNEANTVSKISYPEIEFSTPMKVGKTEDEVYFNFEDPPIPKPYSDKEISPSTKQQVGDAFNIIQEKNRAQTVDKFSFSRDITNKTDLINISEQDRLIKKESTPVENNANKSIALLIDTPGCRIPRLDPWDSAVKHLIELQDPYECPGPPVFMKSNPGGSITVNKTILETYYNITEDELVCYSQPIYRLHEKVEKRERSIMFGRANRTQFGIPLNQDYMSVSCKINGKVYEQNFPLVPIKENVEKERDSLVPPDPTLNVILLGIDSVSKLNYLRHFPRTQAFLNEKLKSFEMNGYIKLADNTFPNLIPMLTGRFVEHWWNETVMDTMFFDDVDFIWKEYAKRGYRTFFAEDSPFTGAFNYFKRGFNDPPTDYYFRPLGLVLERFKMVSGQEKEFCINSQIDIDIIFDYLKDFTQTMGNRPYFAFAMVSSITHDEVNYAAWADEPTERLLDGLLNTGALNNTLLVLFSDHGLRYGPICQTYLGRFEGRLPLMYVHVPKWFLEQHPEIEENLKVNQDRIMTLFDIHATMIHLLDLNKPQRERLNFTLGQSLFEEILPSRTCSEANIETHWCPCQTFENVSLSNPVVIYASNAMVVYINSQLESFGEKCETLEVDSIMDAKVSKASKLMVHYLTPDNLETDKAANVTKMMVPIQDYQITLVAKPGGGVFEGTVRHNPANNRYTVLGTNRINMYGKTSWCIESQNMRVYCYCKIQLT